MKLLIKAAVVALGLFAVMSASCGSSSNNGGKNDIQEVKLMAVEAPAFNADSAFLYVKQQVDFGPRVPNTEAHRKCGDYLASALQRFGAKVYNQHVDLVAYNGTVLKSRNIIGAYKPELKKRVMLCAHWDCRPYADNGDKKYHHTPIDGANDGASGVGVLLEIARQLQQKNTTIGIDIVFFDSEDYGIPQFYDGDYREDTWCLGSQYWGRIPHVSDYRARFAILLDMVGGKNATFCYEGFSARTAGTQMKKIWDIAHESGYGKYFLKHDGGEVVDDHVYVNRFRQIPCVDIIQYDARSGVGFNPTWHTVNDDINHIDKATLKAVGQTVMNVIYNEK